MKRVQAWEPQKTHPGYRFITEWDDDAPDAPHRCIEARLNGAPLPHPQDTYEGVLAALSGDSHD